MTYYAYINSGDVTNVDFYRKEITRYIKSFNIFDDFKIISDEMPVKLHWTMRPIGDLLKKIKRYDHLVVYEAEHLTCSTSQILEILSVAAANRVAIHFIKYGIVISNKELYIETQEIINLIQKIESDFVSKRTSRALARRKAEGLPLGRPKGRGNKSLKLDKFKNEIEKYLTLGISKASIAKLVDCHPQTLYDWIERHETNITSEHQYAA